MSLTLRSLAVAAFLALAGALSAPGQIFASDAGLDGSNDRPAALTNAEQQREIDALRQRAQALREQQGGDGLFLLWPARGEITGYFAEVHWTAPRGHSGLDIAAATGSPIYAAAEGRVRVAGWSNAGYGGLIVVEHIGGYETWYAHLNRILVEPGERVRTGALIAEMGSTGFSTGPHLHLEVRKDGVPRDPLDYLYVPLAHDTP